MTIAEPAAYMKGAPHGWAALGCCLENTNPGP
jgi:hypothetical protein